MALLHYCGISKAHHKPFCSIHSSYLANIASSGVGLVLLSKGEADSDVLDLGVGGDGVVVAINSDGNLRVGAKDQVSQLLSKT